jgi:exonuclease III
LRIATFNVNGVNGRLPVLLRWLAEAEPDVVCLQELKGEVRSSTGACSPSPERIRSHACS